MNRWLHIEPMTSFGRQIYVDFHAPRMHDERLYVLFGINPFEIIIEILGFTFWVHQDAGAWIE